MNICTIDPCCLTGTLIKINSRGKGARSMFINIECRYYVDLYYVMIPIFNDNIKIYVFISISKVLMV